MSIEEKNIQHNEARLKRRVSVRTTAEAGLLLDAYMSEHPGQSEAEITGVAIIDWVRSKMAPQTIKAVEYADQQRETENQAGSEGI